MRPRAAVRRDTESEVDQVETVWANGVVAKMRRDFYSARTLAPGRIAQGPVLATELTQHGAPVGKAVWFEKDRLFAYALPGLVPGMIVIGSKELTSDYGGWPFTPDTTWLNVQLIATHHFKTLARAGRCGHSVRQLASRRGWPNSSCRRSRPMRQAATDCITWTVRSSAPVATITIVATPRAGAVRARGGRSGPAGRAMTVTSMRFRASPRWVVWTAAASLARAAPVEHGDQEPRARVRARRGRLPRRAWRRHHDVVDRVRRRTRAVVPELGKGRCVHARVPVRRWCRRRRDGLPGLAIAAGSFVALTFGTVRQRGWTGHNFPDRDDRGGTVRDGSSALGAWIGTEIRREVRRRR